jgi:hypothetical protein
MDINTTTHMHLKNTFKTFNKTVINVHLWMLQIICLLILTIPSWRFYQLDTNETGKVSIQNFKHLCEVLEINFVYVDQIPPSKDDEGKANLPEAELNRTCFGQTTRDNYGIFVYIKRKKV